eukprot:365869-Chlamydomonas_euryale.AAC.4
MFAPVYRAARHTWLCTRGWPFHTRCLPLCTERHATPGCAHEAGRPHQMFAPVYSVLGTCCTCYWGGPHHHLSRTTDPHHLLSRTTKPHHLLSRTTKPYHLLSRTTKPHRLLSRITQPHHLLNRTTELRGGPPKIRRWRWGCTGAARQP